MALLDHCRGLQSVEEDIVLSMQSAAVALQKGRKVVMMVSILILLAHFPSRSSINDNARSIEHDKSEATVHYQKRCSAAQIPVVNVEDFP